MKKTLLFSFFLSLTLCSVATIWAQAESRNALEAKLALENSLEKRLKMVLSEALGTDDIIVIISADLQEQEKKTQLEIMPGIPKEEKMGELSLSSTLTMLKKLSASLILDKTISEEDTKLARKLTAGLLGLPPEREDLITIEKMNFRKARPFIMSDLLVPPNLWNLTWIILVAALMLVAVLVFLSPLSRAAKAFVVAFAAQNAQAEGQRSEEKREAEVLETKTAAAPESAQGGKTPLFGFLSSDNISSLIFLMKTRTTQDLTILLNYAPKDVSAKLIEALYPKSVQALAALPKITLMPEQSIRALEAEIKAALDYVVGGEDKTLGIMETLDETVQEKAMADFARLNPLFSAKVKSSIVRLADLARLDGAHAQMLARRLPMRVIAAALKGSSYATAFVSKLSGGMQERLNQELELTRALPAEAYKAERTKVTEALRQLIKEGLVSLNTSTTTGAPHPQSAPAASRTGAPATPAHPPAPGANRPATDAPPHADTSSAKLVPAGEKPPSPPAQK
ncbi:MAG TPA: hypothetical protein DCL44_04105 [Elusimicrobia bacterium]|nr:hypothetical protein [Elusimicrobiota bacterium]